MAPSSTNKPAFIPLEIKPVEFSLTAGTDIPAPLESPPSTPGRPPTSGGGPLSSHPTSPRDTPPNNPMDSSNPDQSANGAANGRDRAESIATANTKPGSPGAKNPLSPTPTTESTSGGKRPSSMRRFLGFRTTSSSDSLRSGGGRPNSPPNAPAASGGPVARPGARDRRKSGSWFAKRASTMFGIGSLAEAGEFANGSAIEEDKKEAAAPKGPPPPTLPEFKKLGTELDGGSLGADDLFKNIK